MAFHRKFTFEDPEDSYWNENRSSSSSFFDDVSTKQETARAALDNLFDTDLKNSSVPTQSLSAQQAQTSREASGEPNEAVTPTTNRVSPRKNVLGTDGDGPPRVNSLNKFIGRTDGIKEASTISIAASECSASSLPSEAQQLDLDYSRLRAEHRKLQRHLETIRAERFRAPDVRETVRRILKGDPVSLDLYRSKKEKLELLDAAIHVVDGNVILTVILFLKRSLSDSLFREILLSKPDAAEEYISYLKEVQDTEELTMTLFALGRNSDAAMVEFTAALRAKTTQQKVNSLKKALNSAFSDPTLSNERDSVKKYVDLLERQTQIETADSQDKSSKFRDMPRNGTLVGQPSIHTLYYCSLYHYDLPTSSLACPQSIRDLCCLSDKQYTWTAVSALVRQHRWPDIERLLQPKSLMGVITSRVGQSTKLSCPISMQNLMFILHGNVVQPPKDLLCRLLRTVGDSQEKLRLAEKFAATEIVIECLTQQKDRQRLQMFASKLTPHTPEHYKALAALNNTSIKWRN